MILKLIKFICAMFFLFLGLLIGVLEIIALIDPVGTKMADDADPFGNPHRPWYVHACYFLFVFICFGISFFMFRSLEENDTKSKLL